MTSRTKSFICPECGVNLEVSVLANRKLCVNCTALKRKLQSKVYEKNRTRNKLPAKSRIRDFTCIHCGALDLTSVRGALPKYCSTCRLNYTSIYEKNMRVRRAKDPKQAQKHKVRYRFGISLEHYESLISSQGGMCAVCFEKPESGKILYIDHDHSCCPGEKTCGKCIRKLLCQRCNTALGFVGDNPQILIAMAVYLKNGGIARSSNVKRKASLSDSGEI